MACKPCTHTMQRIADKWFWCPRCGTLKRDYETLDPEWFTPKLVNLARTLGKVGLDAIAD